jgi:hypothetical protein
MTKNTENCFSTVDVMYMASDLYGLTFLQRLPEGSVTLLSDYNLSHGLVVILISFATNKRGIKTAQARLRGLRLLGGGIPFFRII